MTSYKPAFILRDEVLTIVVDNQTYIVPKGDSRYQVLIALSKRIAKNLPVTLAEWKDAVVVKQDPAVAAQKVVSVKDVVIPQTDVIAVDENGVVTVGGKIVHNTVTKRIAEFAQSGLPFEPLVNFLRKLLRNPSYKAQVQLLNFLENRSLPITEDGDFLGYKAVRNDFMDIYSGTIDNSPGKTPNMKRSDVDDDNANQCSKGLHVGGLDYVKGYGTLGRDRIIIVKVNPENAVSVPTDYAHQKLRVCEYFVVGEYKGEMNVSPLYTGDARPYGQDEDTQDDDDFGDDWDNDDDYYDDEDEDDDYEDFVGQSDHDEYGLKPNGDKFHNVRDSSGRFTRK